MFLIKDEKGMGFASFFFPFGVTMGAFTAWGKRNIHNTFR